MLAWHEYRTGERDKRAARVVVAKRGRGHKLDFAYMQSITWEGSSVHPSPAKISAGYNCKHDIDQPAKWEDRGYGRGEQFTES